MTELTDNDRQRIKYASRERYGRGDNWINHRGAFFAGAEYATRYEREQQAELRNKVIEECIQFLKQFHVDGCEYMMKGDELNSLKTK